MSQFYTRAVNTASSLLTRFGQVIKIIRETDGAIDPVTGAITPGDITEYETYGVVKSIEDSLVDDTRILASDRMVTMESKVQVLQTDKLSINGEIWNVEEIKESNPAGIAIVYHVRVRK
jgi:hypothetical protein